MLEQHGYNPHAPVSLVLCGHTSRHVALLAKRTSPMPIDQVFGPDLNVDGGNKAQRILTEIRRLIVPPVRRIPASIVRRAADKVNAVCQ